tara:strand:- start:505 stop:690 length:186 start_codon:yes stop_codon:yes gene_type:complete
MSYGRGPLLHRRDKGEEVVERLGELVQLARRAATLGMKADCTLVGEYIQHMHTYIYSYVLF